MSFLSNSSTISASRGRMSLRRNLSRSHLRRNCAHGFRLRNVLRASGLPAGRVSRRLAISTTYARAAATESRRATTGSRRSWPSDRRGRQYRPRRNVGDAVSVANGAMLLDACRERRERSHHTRIAGQAIVVAHGIRGRALRDAVTVQVPVRGGVKCEILALAIPVVADRAAVAASARRCTAAQSVAACEEQGPLVEARIARGAAPQVAGVAAAAVRRLVFDPLDAAQCAAFGSVFEAMIDAADFGGAAAPGQRAGLCARRLRRR